MSNPKPLVVSDRPASILIEGDRDCNVSDFVLSVVGASLVRSSLPRVLFLTDAKTDGRDAVARMTGWLTNYCGGEKPANKMNCVAYLHNVLVSKPGALANYILEVEPAVSPFWIVRDDASNLTATTSFWHTYATAIRERIRCAALHVVKRGPMRELPVDPKNYDAHWLLKEYVIPNRERINNAMILENMTTGERLVWRDKPQAGGPSLWAPTFEELAHA